MKKITVISGKGGTGKTTLTANFALLAKDLVLADCDVDAPNLHLLLNPELQEAQVFKGAKLAVRNEQKCTQCGLCREVCNFTAVNEDLSIDEIKCDGCGVCVALCPEKALELVDQVTGNIFSTRTGLGPFIHARLLAGADNSGKLVSEVRELAEKVGNEEEKELLLIDGSPGIGCPVIASLQGADMALIVTEPTRSGWSDLKRILEVTDHFGIKSLVLINKYDINEQMTAEIENYCREKNIITAGRIPYDEIINRSLKKGEFVLEFAASSKVARSIRRVWKNVEGVINSV